MIIKISQSLIGLAFNLHYINNELTGLLAILKLIIKIRWYKNATGILHN